MEYLHTDKDGNQVKYTDEMIKNAIVDLDWQKDKSDKAWEKITTIRRLVFDFFNEEYETGNSSITVQVSDVNQLLQDIGANTLKSLFTVTGRIDFSITDVEAESENDARSIVEDKLSLEFDGDGSLDDWSIDNTDVSEQ